MNATRFDRFVKLLSHAGTRRGVLGALSIVPLFGGLASFLGEDEAAAAKGRRKRRKRRHDPGKDRDRRRRRRKGKQHKHKKPCTPPSCEPGICASIPNPCGGPNVECNECDPSGARCCVEGACLPDPTTCLALGTACDSSTCGDCCSKAASCCLPGGSTFCAPAARVGGACASQADCQAPLQCRCGICCCSTCDATSTVPDCNTNDNPDCVVCP